MAHPCRKLLGAGKKMSISIPFKQHDFVELGEAPPFNIQANPAFPDETDPVCILTNLGNPSSSAQPDTFITVGPGTGPNAPDTWDLTFRWATTGGPAAGTWQIDAWLQAVSPFPPGNLVVPGFPQFVGPGGTAVVPQQENHVYTIGPFGSGITFPVGVSLFRLYASLRWIAGASGASPVRVAGHVEGPLIEFYRPA
jgi:hypothetical protein